MTVWGSAEALGISTDVSAGGAAARPAEGAFALVWFTLAMSKARG